MSSNDESLKDTKSLHKTSVSDEVVIKFDHVTKTYNLYKNDRGRFLGIFNYNRKGSFLGSVDASKDLSFEIKKGEAVAFLGRNGAGKSTTLKMVTGVTHPTSGDIEVKGRVSALLELTAGSPSHRTGRGEMKPRPPVPPAHAPLCAPPHCAPAAAPGGLFADIAVIQLGTVHVVIFDFDARILRFKSLN